MSQFGAEPSKLPVHGFVLAGGQSSRMGRDKVSLPFCGRPMIEIAVEKLRGFCAEVSIAGNRQDLLAYGPIVPEARNGAGPIAGMEAGLGACTETWALFMPVDVPRIPSAFLRRWAETVLAREKEGCGASSLIVAGQDQPAFCLLRRGSLRIVTRRVDGGERRLRNLLRGLEQMDDGTWLWMCDAEELAGDLLRPEDPIVQLSSWFSNVNTPQELFDAEREGGVE